LEQKQIGSFENYKQWDNINNLSTTHSPNMYTIVTIIAKECKYVPIMDKEHYGFT